MSGNDAPGGRWGLSSLPKKQRKVHNFHAPIIRMLIRADISSFVACSCSWSLYTTARFDYAHLLQNYLTDEGPSASPLRCAQHYYFQTPKRSALSTSCALPLIWSQSLNIT